MIAFIFHFSLVHQIQIHFPITNALKGIEILQFDYNVEYKETQLATILVLPQLFESYFVIDLNKVIPIDKSNLFSPLPSKYSVVFPCPPHF